MKPHLTIVFDDDWQAAYLDGLCFAQGHSVSKDTILEKLQQIGLLTYTEQEGIAAMTGYSFPTRLEDVQYDPDWTEDYED